jgi:hypothetical protein
MVFIVIMEDPVLKLHKKKAMSSEKASVVKKAGHANETDFAALIGGSVVPGRGKGDVVKNGTLFSLKKVCKRIQVALYSKNSKNWVESSPSAMICKDVLTIYPETFDDYKASKDHFKSLLRPKMIAFKEHLSEPINLKKYLSLVFTHSGEVEFLVMKDGNKQYVFDAAEAIDTIVSCAQIANSKARKAGDTPEQKVLVTIPKGGIFINLLELEIRNSSKGHYAEFLCVCNRDPLLQLLQDSIKEEVVFFDCIVVRGKAVQNFEKKIVS